MSKEIMSAGIAGLLTSGLFLIVFGIGLGFVFMFLPTLPLFFLGLSKFPRLTHGAIAFAAVLITLIAGPASAMLFMIFLGVPTWYFSKKSLLSVPSQSGEAAWYPVGFIIMDLTLYACALVALMTLYYTGQEGGLPQIMSQNIREAFSGLESEYGEIVEQMASGWAFLMFPVTIWLWGVILYAHAWLSNRVLVRRNANSRPHMAIEPFTMPAWMLTLLVICALASLIGSPSMSFLGKSVLLSLMLPYFFSGCAQMHKSAKTWPSYRFFIFFVYFMVFTQFWPALILAGFGLWHQIKALRVVA